MRELLVFMCVIAAGCGEAPPPKDDGNPICWGTLTNRMAFLAGWMSKTQCGIIDNTKGEEFSQRTKAGACTVPYDIEGGEVGKFTIVYIPERQVGQAVYVHPGNPNDGVVNEWPCPAEVLQ